MKIADLRRFIPAFAGKRIIILGDLMLDRYLAGDVERISPEAPVPVLTVQSERDVPGGAANVVACLHALGAEAVPCGLIGSDEDGAKLEGHFRALGLGIDALVKDALRPTTKKTRVIAGRQQIVRIDHEDKSHCSPEIVEGVIGAFESIFCGSAPCDGVIISDYGKGLLQPRLIEYVIERCRETKIPLAVDPKLEFFKSYRGVTLITPNTKEASESAGIPIRDTASLLAAGTAICAAIDPEILLITRSEHGMALFPRGQGPMEIPTRAREVFDVTGAGDMVIAAATLALVSGANAHEAACIANIAAGLEVQKLGCQTVSPAELMDALGSAF
jgi:D-beta-D-heptose 7-phosphate kinase/D-beta-D-heptose 1-phosphate adenosyltransferase